MPDCFGENCNNFVHPGWLGKYFIFDQNFHFCHQAMFASSVPEIIELIGTHSKYEGSYKKKARRRFLKTISLKLTKRMKIQGVFFFHWYPPKKLKYGKHRLGESTLT